IVKFFLRDLKLNPNFQDKSMMTPLRWAAYLGYKNILKDLLTHQAEDLLDEYGQNVVFYAAKKGHIECLDLLAKANADFSVRNNEGLTALEKAADKDTSRFIKKLKSKIVSANLFKVVIICNMFTGKICNFSNSNKYSFFFGSFS
ncbi:hypothetical protein RFI_03434, partial [Reticulomyxa filosa]